MIRSIYTAASNMVAQLHRQMVIANNVANVDTPGYKQDLVTQHVFSDMLLQNSEDGATTGEVGTGVMVPQVTLDRTQGELLATNRPYDLALTGPGFFVVETPEGIRYTRAGLFQRDAGGALVTTDGGKVLGRNGPIRWTGSAEVQIASDGRITAGGQDIDQLQLVEFAPDARLMKMGNGYLMPEGAPATPAAQTRVAQGFIEQSNVDYYRATGEMMSALRAYQANQQVIQLLDQSLERTVNDVGRMP